MAETEETMPDNSTRWLLADVGGTNTRLALWHPGESSRKLRNLQNFRNAEFASLCELLQTYLKPLRQTDENPQRAVLAIAAPLRGDYVRMLNLDWEFERGALRADLGLDALEIINDFHAQAYALPILEDRDLVRIGDTGVAVPGAAMAVLGAGTGLGVAGMTPCGDRYAVVTGEGGHVTLAAANAFEAQVIEEIRKRIGHCSAERILSGAGLELLHDVLHDGPKRTAGEISELAAKGDQDARATFDVFFDFLGTVASDLALTLGALGGTFVSGGIGPRNRELLLASGFRDRFVDKGRYRSYLQAIPTWLVTADYAALYGAANYVTTVLLPRYRDEHS